MEGVIAVSIPIVAMLVTGIVLVTFFYLRSREKQLLIEKGLPPESIMDFFEGKKDPNALLKIGIISIAFGLGLGLGLILEDTTGKDYFIPLALFIFTGVGFVAANLISKKN